MAAWRMRDATFSESCEFRNAFEEEFHRNGQPRTWAAFIRKHVNGLVETVLVTPHAAPIAEL